MNFWRRLTSRLSLIFLLAVVAEAMVLQFQNPEHEGEFSNMQVYDGKIYIGEGNYIFVLNASNLQLSDTNKTCKNNCKKSFNKVLLINSVSKKLIECATNNDGTCRIRDLNTLAIVFISNSNPLTGTEDYLTVATNERRPASFTLDAESNTLFTGVTYGNDLMTTADGSYKYYLASYNLTRDTFAFTKTLQLLKREYLVYFKASFQVKEFIYFVTNQKYKQDDGYYISKLIRFCKKNEDFLSYTDIMIKCRDENQTYALIQDVTVFPPGNELMESMNLTYADLIVAATFTNGTDPENPGVSSAVCLYTLRDIDEQIIEAKKQFYCPVTALPEHEPYLDVKRPKDCIKDFNVSWPLCNKTKMLPGFKNIIGDISITAAPTYSALAEQLGKIHGVTVSNNKFNVLFTGTSRGKLFQITVHSTSYTDKSEKYPDEKYPITEIFAEPDGKIQYVLSTRKVVKYETKDCSLYRTCQETMKAKNPLCGWCVYEIRSTFTDNISCPFHLLKGHWLSPFTWCLSISAEPRGVAILQQKNISITVNAGFPVALVNDSYSCVFVTRKNTLDKVSANRTGDVSTIFCETPAKQSHTDATLQLIVHHGNRSILLAETDFLFFDCGHYKKCGSCTEDKRAECSWCTADTVCQSQASNCSLKVNQSPLCPKFDNSSDVNFLPHGTSKALSFSVSNLINTDGPNRTEYYCDLNEAKVKALMVTEEIIMCNLTVWLEKNEGKKEYKINILYGTSMLDDSNTVVVYNCEVLGLDCSICGSLNRSYQCSWCSKSDTDVSCQFNENECEALLCPKPTIEKVVPETVAINGGILVQISGHELGSSPSDAKVSLAGIACLVQNFGFEPSVRLFCEAQASNDTVSGPVIVTVHHQNVSAKAFSYKIPSVSQIIPESGPLAGGTRLTMRGKELGVGRRSISVNLWNTTTSVTEDSITCINAEVVPMEPLSEYSSEMFSIECSTPEDKFGLKQLRLMELLFDNATVVPTKINFTYLPNPEIGSLSPLKGISSGGTEVTVSGTKFNNAHQAYLTGNFQGGIQPCMKDTDMKMICILQNLTAGLKKDLDNKLKGQNLDQYNRHKREDDREECLSDNVTIHLDGVSKRFIIAYYTDPTFYDFEDENGVKVLEEGQTSLIIKGKNLNLVARKNDISVVVGLGKCPVVELYRNNLTCLSPDRQQATGELETSHLEVNVSIGNIHRTVGVVKYMQKTEPLEVNWIIGAAVGGVLLAIVVIIVVCLIIKYRSASYKMRDLERQWEEEEMVLKDVAIKEFADMQIGMSAVSSHLIEKGCPYHSYQQYAVNVLFPNEPITSYPLMQNPNIPDVRRSVEHDGMKKMDSLISNKYFLLSVIYTLDRQKKFKFSDKASFCGHLCTVLLGKMEYLQEICVSLLDNLISESAGKKNQKVLFRRCETISEKLLSRWLSLCLYPHLKEHSGYPLYLLYKASQIHIEAGPIDAITHDTKYTLSEEKLLKDYHHQPGNGTNESKFVTNCLTLKVTAESRRETIECMVLDCDTITQVKEKCLAQIYINQPASKLKRTASELILEWHSGRGGKLQLNDKDNTSQTDGDWVRLNTLAHYCVQNESQMTLIDPLASHGSPSVSVNVDQIRLSPKPDTDTTDSNDTGTTTRCWHVVKPEADDSQPKMLLTDMFYKNRLLTFKQAVLKYIRAVFDTVLQEDTLPPHVHFLYNLFDEFREKHKIEEETIQSWKSESYLIHIWASLMRKPGSVFDINTPPYVETTMEVISQVFVESLSRDYQDATKDSTIHKLLFNNERNHYRTEAKRFYRAVSAKQFQPEILRNYLEDVNKLQQRETNLNKETAVYKLYQQLEPYMLEILDDLSTSPETSRLRLGNKLEEINALMNNNRDGQKLIGYPS